MQGNSHHVQVKESYGRSLVGLHPATRGLLRLSSGLPSM